MRSRAIALSVLTIQVYEQTAEISHQYLYIDNHSKRYQMGGGRRQEGGEVIRDRSPSLVFIFLLF